MTGTWQVTAVDDPADFMSRAGTWLLGHAVDANVIGSVLAGTVAQPASERDPTTWLLVLDGDGEVAGVAMSRPDYELFLPDLPPGAAAAIAEKLVALTLDVPGAAGSVEAARDFCLAWHRATGRTWEQASASRVYVLDALKPPGGVPGERRTATPSDAGLAVTWADAFLAETDAVSPGRGQRDLVTRRIAAAEISLWVVDGEAVSMAAASPVVGGVARVNLVYTPPTERGHGYGSAVTAAVTQRAMDEGADTCMLYADLANPTSNEIYRRIGYRDFADSVVMRFT